MSLHLRNLKFFPHPDSEEVGCDSEEEGCNSQEVGCRKNRRVLFQGVLDQKQLSAAATGFLADMVPDVHSGLEEIPS